MTAIAQPAQFGYGLWRYIYSCFMPSPESPHNSANESREAPDSIDHHLLDLKQRVNLNAAKSGSESQDNPETFLGLDDYPSENREVLRFLGLLAQLDSDANGAPRLSQEMRESLREIARAQIRVHRDNPREPTVLLSGPSAAALRRLIAQMPHAVRSSMRSYDGPIDPSSSGDLLLTNPTALELIHEFVKNGLKSTSKPNDGGKKVPRNGRDEASKWRKFGASDFKL